MDTLPKEIKLLFLSYLNVDELINNLLVSKEFYNICKSDILWMPLIKKKFGNVDKINGSWYNSFLHYRKYEKVFILSYDYGGFYIIGTFMNLSSTKNGVLSHIMNDTFSRQILAPVIKIIFPEVEDKILGLFFTRNLYQHERVIYDKEHEYPIYKNRQINIDMNFQINVDEKLLNSYLLINNKIQPGSIVNHPQYKKLREIYCQLIIYYFNKTIKDFNQNKHICEPNVYYYSFKTVYDNEDYYLGSGRYRLDKSNIKF